MMLRTALAYGLLFCLALPSAKAWQHVRDGHVEILCSENIPNHIHQAEFSCEFQKYPFSMLLQAPGPELREATSPVRNPISSGAATAPEREALRLYSLRAPPV